MTKISFCITCMGRMDNAKICLDWNLKNNIKNIGDVEFVFLDCGKNEGLTEWISENYRYELEKGYLSYYYCNMKYWHSSVAKNTCHKLARGEYLINLDCDNFCGIRGGEWILSQLEKKGGNDIVLHMHNGEKGSGTFGRIGINKKVFDDIGGYDESLMPMGYQDNDLIERCKLLGYTVVKLVNKNYAWSIQQTKTESLLNIYKEDFIECNWNEMRKANKFFSYCKYKNGIYRANIERNIGFNGNIYKLYVFTGNTFKMIEIN